MRKGDANWFFMHAHVIKIGPEISPVLGGDLGVESGFVDSLLWPSFVR